MDGCWVVVWMMGWFDGVWLGVCGRINLWVDGRMVEWMDGEK
jgi:hypothetical protein